MTEDIIELVPSHKINKDINNKDLEEWRKISEKIGGSSFFIPNRNLLIFGGREITI